MTYLMALPMLWRRPVAGCVGSRDPCPSTPTQRCVYRKPHPYAGSRPAHKWGSLVLGPAVSMVSIGAQGHHYHRPETLVRWHRAGFRRYWRWKSRPLGGRTEDRRGPARVDPADERGKSAVGCAAHPWRATQARLRGRSVQRREVYGQAMWTAVPGMAHLP